MLSTAVVSYKVASVSKNEQTNENLKKIIPECCIFVCLFVLQDNIMGYQIGEVVASELLVVVERGSQYYRCGNVCPIAILERCFSSVR